MSLTTLLLVYIAGGLTFIPLVIILGIGFSYLVFTKPAPGLAAKEQEKDDEQITSPSDNGPVKEKSKDVSIEPDVTAAYFAVCREYVPGGVNGKPPERSTPAGEVLIAESPSVYQSMYRSIFERGKNQIPTIENDKRDGRVVRRARNVFFVVLRHGHLMLYDDAEQVEVRHVISLAHHNVDIYAGGDPLPEGDLWIKRHCIRLSRKPSSSRVAPSSKPFYFFSDNSSQKEDFYHALLLYQSAANDEDAPPRPMQFDTQDIIKLVQQLHGPDSDPHNRWLNALIGRVFLAMYKTDDVENFIRGKINRKISRVPKPNFITAIQIQDIDMGDSGPIISNPKLKELNVNGDTTVEFDVKYNGRFKLQMGAIARIELGSRLKAREVSLIMAGTLRKLSGHMLVRIKPPPSNRLWIAFETMPNIEMSIEPVVSSRQITYGIILRAIESRIREVIGETLVLPNWDDSPFLDTSRKAYRGGIFESNATVGQNTRSKEKEAEDHVLETAVQELAKDVDSDTEDPVPVSLKEANKKTMSMPSLVDPAQKLNLRKTAKKSTATLAEDNIGTTTVASTSGSSIPTMTAPSPPLAARKPKTMRSHSFASAATPLVSTEGSNIEPFKPEIRNKRNSKGAMDFVKEVNSRNQSRVSSPTPSDVVSGLDDVPPLDMDRDVLAKMPEEHAHGDDGDSFNESNISETLRRLSEPTTPGHEIADTNPRSPSTPSISVPVSRSPSRTPSQKSSGQSVPTASHLSVAASAAKKWSLNVLNRQSTNSSGSSSSSVPFTFPKKNSTNSSLNTTSSSSSSLPPQHAVPHPDAIRAAMLARGEPMGRGQPLPPPGVPLPGPPGQKSLWSTSGLNLGMGGLKRKPVPAPALPPRREETQKETPPPLPARNQSVGQAPHSSVDVGDGVGQREDKVGDDLIVVAAPKEEDEEGTSLSASPVAEEASDDVGNTVLGEGSEGTGGALVDDGKHDEHVGKDRLGVGDDGNALSMSTETIRPEGQRGGGAQGTSPSSLSSAEQEQSILPSGESHDVEKAHQKA